MNKLKKSQEIIAFCVNGARAQMAYELLSNKGYKRVSFLNEAVEFFGDGEYKICCTEVDK